MNLFRAIRSAPRKSLKEPIETFSDCSRAVIASAQSARLGSLTSSGRKVGITFPFSGVDSKNLWCSNESLVPSVVARDSIRNFWKSDWGKKSSCSRTAAILLYICNAFFEVKGISIANISARISSNQIREGVPANAIQFSARISQIRSGATTCSAIPCRVGMPSSL